MIFVIAELAETATAASFAFAPDFLIARLSHRRLLLRCRFDLRQQN